MDAPPFRFLEFFAGGGMARIGLDGVFDCAFANDNDPDKCAAYRANFGFVDLVEGDIEALAAADLPDADLAWASFPCQDLSLAGARTGLKGARSGVFWAFWWLIEALDNDGRAPPVIALENVSGLLSSNGGRDFAWLCEALAARGWRVGALILDAADFTPQSRPRLFIVAYRGAPPAFLASESPGYGHTRGLIDAVGALDEATRSAWVWWRLAPPPVRNASLEDLTERIGAHLGWRSQEALDKLLSQMTPAHRARVEAARAEGVYRVGAVYRRIRDGVQRAEVRYDGLAGCVRTLKGGSSRQLLLVSAAGELRLRAMTAVESARLMGLPADYKLPPRATAAFNLTGDGVCAPVVRWLGLKLLAPLAEAAQGARDGRNRRPLERSVTG